MSNRRVPLASNQNAANSPLRNPALKQKRTLTQLQREEPYGQPPPTKKLVLDAGTQRVVRSQPQPPPRVSKSAIPVQSRRSTNSTYDTKLARERAAARQQQDAAAVTEFTEKDIEEIQVWKAHHVARFPKSLFYFDQIPNDVAHRLKRQIAALGGVRASPSTYDGSYYVPLTRDFYSVRLHSFPPMSLTLLRAERSLPKMSQPVTIAIIWPRRKRLLSRKKSELRRSTHLSSPAFRTPRSRGLFLTPICGPVLIDRPPSWVTKPCDLRKRWWIF